MIRFDIRREKKGPRLQGSYLASVFLTMAAIFCLPQAAETGSASATLGVSVRVVSNCSISASSLDFGDYDPTLTHATADLSARTSLTMACRRGSNPAVAIGLGSNSTSAVTTRSMSNGGGMLSYEIYKDSALTQIWSDSAAGSLSLGTVTSTQPIIIPVHGRIPAGQAVGPGSYTDSVIVTVNF